MLKPEAWTVEAEALTVEGEALTVEADACTVEGKGCSRKAKAWTWINWMVHCHTCDRNQLQTIYVVSANISVR